MRSCREACFYGVDMSTFDRVVQAGKSFACSLYRNQPGALIPNPISDVLHLVWDNLCGDDPDGLPPPPASPFQGGQCQCRSYRITHVIDWNDGTSWTNTNDVWGAVTGIYCKPGDLNNRCQPIVQCRGFTFQGGCQPSGDYGVSSFSNGSPTGAPPRIRITSAVLLDGQPDNCGNLPPSFPPSPPPPTGGYTSPPTIINYNDGSDFTAIFNLKPPTGDSPPPPDICLSVVVSGVEVKLCFPFGLPPSFGDGDNGGIADILTDIQNNINNLQDDVDNLQDDFDKFTDPPPPESDPDLNETDSPDDGGGEEDNLPGLKWVVVQLTTLPVKAQFGTPSVNFAGWITFKIGGDYTDRIPIAFENGVFQAPPGATGYAITFTNQAKGISKAYTRDITP